MDVQNLSENALMLVMVGLCLAAWIGGLWLYQRQAGAAGRTDTGAH